MHVRWLLVVAWLISFTVNATAQDTKKNRLHGYVGGPYKVLLEDFTGDKHIDILYAYQNLGIVSVDQGNGKGQLRELELNLFGDEDRKLNPNDATWSVPHVHNVAVGDIDDDGLLDIVCAVGGLGRTKKGRIVIARNRGEGRFERQLEYPVPSQAKGVRFADMDNDGRLDLLYTARGSGYEDDLKIGRLYIRRGIGGWNFGDAIEGSAGKSAYYITVSDLNNDGFLDVAIPNEHDSTVTYFINPGKSLFTNTKALQSRQVRATQIPNRRSHAVNDVRSADLNKDGNQDLITANLGTSTISIFLGKGDGTFEKDTIISAGKNGAFLATGDFDSDGDIDFVITHWTEDFASVFLNRGNATFADRVDYKTGSGNYGVDVADLNGDGHLDVVTANYRALTTSVLLGKGDGSFRKAKTTSKGLRGYEDRIIRHHKEE